MGCQYSIFPKKNIKSRKLLADHFGNPSRNLIAWSVSKSKVHFIEKNTTYLPPFVVDVVSTVDSLERESSFVENLTRRATVAASDKPVKGVELPRTFGGKTM